MNLSRHFTYEELVRSTTAVRRGIVNIPGPEALANLVTLCNKILEPVRELVGKRIFISSGYRCPELNSVIGGSGSSQHMTGSAADFDVDGMAVPDVFWAILHSPIPFDQLINEFGEWIHVSYSDSPRREAKVAVRNDEGEVEFKHITPNDEATDA